MKAIISRTTNGAWVRFVDKNDIEPLQTQDFSYEFDAYKHDGEDMSGLVSMLHEMMDRMGWSGDRHDEQRVQVRIVHGDKFQHANEKDALDCLICARNGSCGYHQEAA